MYISVLVVMFIVWTVENGFHIFSGGSKWGWNGHMEWFELGFGALGLCPTQGPAIKTTQHAFAATWYGTLKNGLLLRLFSIVTFCW